MVVVNHKHNKQFNPLSKNLVHQSINEMDRVKDDLGKLGLECLPDDWVNAAFLAEFTAFGDIPEEYQSILDSIQIESVFENLLESICKVDLEETSWAQLSQEIAYKHLLAVIGYHIKLGVNQVVRSECRDSALLAARVYFRLLMIEGARGYEVYHSQLFAHTISCLGFPKMMCEISNQFGNNKNLSVEVNNVLRALSEYVIDLKDIILQLKLKPNDINFEDILGNLLDVAGGSITQTLANVDKIVFSKILGMIYHVITCMLCNYGDQPSSKAIELLFKCMVPKLIAVCGDTKAASNFVRASYVTYSGLIVTSYAKASIRSYIILLEHLCYNTELLERAEARSARSELVVGLMSLLSDQRHRRFVKWLLVLSTTAKVQHRNMALEILARLLNNEPEINEQRATIWSEIEKQRAVEATLRHVAADHSYGRPVAEDTSEDSQHSKENEEPEEGDEETGFLRQQAHTVPLSSILAAVYECAQDSSSQVRSRALAVLCESVASERPHMRRALEELNGDGEAPRLTALASRGVCDERAVVRRSAVTLMLRVLRASPRALVADDLAILVKLCRDAALTVRTAAINAVVELLLQRHSEATVDAFLRGAMPQLSDPEQKVIDVVKAHVEQLLLRRLVKHAGGGFAEDQLPWMLLQGFIKRKMKRHLEMACGALAKTENCISVRLVDILSSHVGVSTERDLQCLLLLTCVARHVAYSDLGFVLDKYYKITREPDPVDEESLPPARADPRILQQILDLLSSWSQYMKPPDRTALRAYLVARVATVDDGCRVPSILLASTLDPANLYWATELMQLSEKRAIEGRCLKEAMRAADVAVVAPEPPTPALLQMFLSAVEHPPPDYSEAMMGMVVVGLGRVCLRWRAAAAAAAPVLARVLLDRAASLQARVNALLALADISKSYTSLVEPLLERICACLRVSEPARLRRAASHTITGLLLSGFLRLRDSMYYKYVALLADSDGEVREPVEYYVTSTLKPDTICNNFVDCIMRYNRTNQEEDITLDFDARQLVYDLLLQRLTIVQKLNTQCRLARDVLQHAAELADQEEDIPEDLHNAMLDTIRVLTGPRMRLPRKPQQVGDMADIEDLQERVTTNIVSHKMKRTVAEVMVPAVMRLYARLAARGGQLAAYLVLLAQDLEQDYQQEIEELLENDEELVERIALFREHFSMERGAGNARNLVAASGPPEPETPHPPRRRPRPVRRSQIKKRSLNI